MLSRVTRHLQACWAPLRGLASASGSAAKGVLDRKYLGSAPDLQTAIRRLEKQPVGYYFSVSSAKPKSSIPDQNVLSAMKQLIPFKYEVGLFYVEDKWIAVKGDQRHPTGNMGDILLIRSGTTDARFRPEYVKPISWYIHNHPTAIVPLMTNLDLALTSHLTIPVNLVVGSSGYCYYDTAKLQQRDPEAFRFLSCGVDAEIGRARSFNLGLNKDEEEAFVFACDRQYGRFDNREEADNPHLISGLRKLGIEYGFVPWEKAT